MGGADCFARRKHLYYVIVGKYTRKSISNTPFAHDFFVRDATVISMNDPDSADPGPVETLSVSPFPHSTCVKTRPLPITRWLGLGSLLFAEVIALTLRFGAPILNENVFSFGASFLF